MSRLLLALVLVYSLAIRLWAAAWDPGPGRYWDERYGMENAAAALDGRWLAPANAFHPTLSYLPHAAALWIAEQLGVTVRRGPLDFTPAAYLIARTIQALAGTLGLLALYLLARRLMPWQLALLAAVLLAIVPWHLRQSTVFKPDVGLMTLVVLALLWSSQALETGRLGHYALAGLGIGLAASTKYNGLAAAVPLAALAPLPLALPPELPRRLARLAVATAVAGAVVLALNAPLLAHPDLVRRNVGRTLRDYERKAARQEAALLDRPAHAVASLVSDRFHGPLVGTVALFGLAALVPTALRRRSAQREARTTALVVLVFAAGYVLLYSAATANLSEHNWLPLAPVTAVGAAFGLWQAGQWLASRAAARRERFAAAGRLAFGGLLLAVLVAATLPYARRLAVPDSVQRAVQLLGTELQPSLPQRVVYQDAALRPIKPKQRRRFPVIRPLTEPAPAAELLDRADAEIYRSDRSQDALRRRLRAVPPEHVIRIAGPWFRVRSPELVAIVHPWRAAGAPVALTPRGTSGVFAVPPLAPETLVSLEAATRRPRKGSTLAARADDAIFPLHFTGRVKSLQFFVSERLPRGVLGHAVRFAPAAAVDEVRMWVWRPPGAP